MDLPTRVNTLQSVMMMISMICPNQKKRKSRSINKSSRKEVEVLYSDGVWYKGWLGDYNFETGKWVVHFYEDNETTEVNSPDDEVRVLN